MWRTIGFLTEETVSEMSAGMSQPSSSSLRGSEQHRPARSRPCLVVKTIVQTLVAMLVGVAQVAAQSTRDGEDTDVTATILEVEREAWTGDLEGMQKRGVIRVLVSYSRTNFFIDEGRARGFEYELAKDYGKFVNHGAKRDSRVQMVYVPMPFDELIPALRKGEGDMIAAGMSVTPESADLVQFTGAYMPAVDEIVVANKSVSGLRTLDDLSGQRVMLLDGSAYVGHVEALNERLRSRGKAAVEIRLAPPEFEVEDILELVHAGIVDLTIADNHVAEIWAGVLPNLVTYPDLATSKGGKIAWAIRKDSPEFLASLNAFVSKNRRGSALGNILFKRYFENRKWITDPAAPESTELLGQYAPLFKEFAAEYGFDWQLIAALAYQESRFDQGERSNRGAVGLMQMKPSTARDPNIGIRDISTARNNVEAGVKYLAFLRKQYFSESGIEPAEQVRFALAAYNAGPGSISKMRDIADEKKLDSNKWLGNVAEVTLRHIGSQPVVYVANISKYYYAYKLANEALTRRADELDALEAKDN